MSPEYLPKEKKAQDLEVPESHLLSYERHLIGVGFEGAWSFYFIFNDGTKTETKSDFIFQDTQRQVADLSNFREVFIDPEDAQVRKVRLRYRNKNYAGN